jgi:hypothetical protein
VDGRDSGCDGLSAFRLPTLRSQHGAIRGPVGRSRATVRFFWYIIGITAAIYIVYRGVKLWRRWQAAAAAAAAAQRHSCPRRPAA